MDTPIFDGYKSIPWNMNIIVVPSRHWRRCRWDFVPTQRKGLDFLIFTYFFKENESIKTVDGTQISHWRKNVKQT